MLRTTDVSCDGLFLRFRLHGRSYAVPRDAFVVERDTGRIWQIKHCDEDTHTVSVWRGGDPGGVPLESMRTMLISSFAYRFDLSSFIGSGRPLRKQPNGRDMWMDMTPLDRLQERLREMEAPPSCDAVHVAHSCEEATAAEPAAEADDAMSKDAFVELVASLVAKELRARLDDSSNDTARAMAAVARQLQLQLGLGG